MGLQQDYTLSNGLWRRLLFDILLINTLQKVLGSLFTYLFHLAQTGKLWFISKYVDFYICTLNTHVFIIS